MRVDLAVRASETRLRHSCVALMCARRPDLLGTSRAQSPAASTDRRRSTFVQRHRHEALTASRMTTEMVSTNSPEPVTERGKRKGAT